MKQTALDNQDALNSQDALDSEDALNSQNAVGGDPITIEIMATTPRLRDDLSISRQSYRGQHCFVIDDPASGQFFRVGHAEYTFLSLLDGRTTVAESLAVVAGRHGRSAMNEQDAASLCGWLVESELAVTAASRTGGRITESIGRRRQQQWIGRANPMFQSFDLLDPSPLVDPIARCARRIGAPVWSIAAVTVVVAAFVAAASHGRAFVGDTTFVRDPSHWVWIAVVFACVKCLHELGHAVVCRSLGGVVRRSGVMMILMVPMPYVDVTSSWRMTSKWRRIAVAAAGMATEWVIATAAIWIWIGSSDPAVRMIAASVVWTCAVTTIVFNLNPLMKFDGYYILADALELPNLSTNAARWTAYARSRYLWGHDVPPPHWPEGRRCLVACYGVAAMVWRIMITVTLILAASRMFWGGGVVLAAVAAGFWLAAPVQRLAAGSRDGQRIRPARAIGLATAAIVLMAAAMLVPVPRSVTAPVVIAAHQPSHVHAAVSGTIAEVRVGAGDRVRRGDVLAVLRNDSLDLDIRRLQIEIEQTRQRRRAARGRQQIVDADMQSTHLTAMKTRLTELDRQFNHLMVRSPIDGQIIASEIQDSVGQQVRQGQPMVTIAPEHLRDLSAMITPEDADRLTDRSCFEGRLWIDGVGTVESVLRFDRLDPSVTDRPISLAMTAAAGGELPVRPATDRPGHWRLISPRLVATATVNLDDDSAPEPSRSSRWATGRTGRIKFPLRSSTVARMVQNKLTHWWIQTAGADRSG